MRASRMVLAIDPAQAFEALCAMEDRADLTDAEIALMVALRVALRPAVGVTLRSATRREAR